MKTENHGEKKDGRGKRTRLKRVALSDLTITAKRGFGGGERSIRHKKRVAEGGRKTQRESARRCQFVSAIRACVGSEKVGSKPPNERGERRGRGGGAVKRGDDKGLARGGSLVFQNPAQGGRILFGLRTAVRRKCGGPGDLLFFVQVRFLAHLPLREPLSTFKKGENEGDDEVVLASLCPYRGGESVFPNLRYGACGL